MSRGSRGPPDAPSIVVLSDHDLGIEHVVDPEHPVGREDAAGIAGIIVECAPSIITGLEDSLATVDAEEKLLWRNSLDPRRARLGTSVAMDEQTFVRRVEPVRSDTSPGAKELVLVGRSLMLERDVGLLMGSWAAMRGSMG
jgi:malate synthase